MKNVELLAPAGSFEALQAAIHNGADAIYLSGNMYGARAFAKNFDDDELKEAIAYAHIYDVKIYVTINTLIYDEEICDVLSYVERLVDYGADALIIQDLGLFTQIHQLFPQLELHASTQMHIHNAQGISLLKEMGATRVVLPRETPIETIRELCKLGIEIEIFVQGALCVGYSGQCLFSSKILSRSGNRGACAQPCRMQYILEETKNNQTKVIPMKDKYLLSPKDLNTIEHIDELIEAGVTSFKIEGRMKRSEYVALMCQLYKEAIQKALAHRKFHLNPSQLEDMQKIFNRGFTCGYVFHEKQHALMNFHRPNHMGIIIGKIHSIQKDKITILLSKQLSQGDGIRILNTKGDEGFTLNRLYKNGLLVKQADANDYIQIDKTMYVKKGDIVLKTSDHQQLKQLQASYQDKPRKQEIKAQFIFNQNPILKVWDDEHMIEIKSSYESEIARNQPLTTNRIITQLEKTKDTPFHFSHIEVINDENRIMPIKEINAMRRNALQQLENIRKKPKPLQKKSIQYPKLHMETTHQWIYVVHTKQQYLACKNQNVSPIYIENSILFEELKDDKNVFYRGKRVVDLQKDTKYPLIQECGGSLYYDHFISDTSLNVCNAHSAAFLFQQGANIVTLSLEHTQDSIQNLTKTFEKLYHTKGNFAYYGYGHEELMVSKYCAIQACTHTNDQMHCMKCKYAQYHLVDQKQRRYPLLTDEDCKMHILHPQPTDHIDAYPQYKNMDVTNALCVFTIESYEECIQIMKRIKKVMHHE